MHDVELRELRTFLILAEELHFGRTAQRMWLTPSRVSQILRQLETNVGGALFERTSRRVRLTPLGEHLRDRAERGYRQLVDAVASTRELARPNLHGPLRVGMYSTCNGGQQLIDIVKAFEANNPDCKVVVVNTGLDRDQFDWLRSGDVDLLTMRLPIHDPSVTIGPVLSTEPRVLAVALDHPLAARESVSVEDLAPYTVSDVPTLPREMIDAFIPPRTPSGKRLRRTPSSSIAESSVRVALSEIVHPTVPSYLEHYPHPGVTSVPIRDLPPSSTALVCLNETDNPMLTAFIREAWAILRPWSETA